MTLKEPRIGAYSGNERLDPSSLEEPDGDNEETAHMFLEDIPSDEDFITETRERYEKYRNILSMSGNPDQFQVHMVGESHIDIAWLWRFEQTRKKGAKTLQKAIYHARRFPGSFCFALSEPILLQWIKEDDPDLFAQVQETVKSGAIELVGGAYVEPDCMMPAGEAFIRHRLYGMRFYQTHFGQLPEVEWFLDSFGYNWGLPQILAKSGAKYFWTSKLTWNMNTVFPFVYFWWQGVDGTRLMTSNFPMAFGSLDSWFMFEVGRRPLKPGVEYIGDYNRDYEDIADYVTENEICPHIGCFFGAGDGGHGPMHREVAEANGLVDVGPLFRWSRVHDFFRAVEEWYPRFPVWADELYLENHQGTFSVHAEVKRHNRLFENYLTSTETLASIAFAAGGGAGGIPVKRLEETWQIVLKNQFHDVLPGSSIPEVYDDLVEDWATCHATLQSILADVSGHVVAPEGSQFMVFNPLSWPRIARIFIPASILNEEIALDSEGRPPAAALQLLGASSRRVPAQPVAVDPEGWKEPRPAGWWAVANLESLSVTPCRLVIGEEDGNALVADATAPHLDNGILCVELDPSTGGIATMASTLVPTIGNLVQGSLNNLTEAYEDKSKAWPAWNITPRYWEFPVAMPNDQDVAIAVRDCGPVFATLDVTRTLGADRSLVTQRYTVFKDCPELFCDYVADWQTPMVMLKLGIDTTTGATRCTADITYGAAERSTVPVTPADKARIEKICHKYYDVSTHDDVWGVATLNEGKYAFDANEGRTRVTMLRSPPYPDPASESWTRKERQARLEKDGTKVPTHSGLGPFRCRYAYLPHAGGGLRTPEGDPNPAVKHAAEEFNTPVIVVKLPLANNDAEGLVVDGTPFVEVSVPNIAVTVIKANEWELNGNLIMRVVETLGQDGEADITLGQSMAKNIAGIREVDLLERVDGCVPATNIPRRGASFHVSLHKFEIKTFELVLT